MPPIVTSAQVNALLQQSNKWRLMPENSNSENSPSPSTYYGAVHLTRLFGEFAFSLTSGAQKYKGFFSAQKVT